MFVKSGSIIPMTKASLSTEEMCTEYKYKIYADGPCSYVMYSDAGDGYAYETGEYTEERIDDSSNLNN